MTGKLVDLQNQLVALELGNYGSVAELYETPAPGVHEPRDQVEVCLGKGFAGDHPQKSFYRGAYVPGREVSVVSAEVMGVLEVDTAAIGDNMVVTGVDLGAIPPGSEISAGEVLLVRSGREHRPCGLFRERTSDRAYELASLGFRGALFVVLKPGIVRLGDAVTVR